MIFIHGYCKRPFMVVVAAVLLGNGAVWAQNYGSMGIRDVVEFADKQLRDGKYEEALPALEEVLLRTSALTDPQGRQTAQTCRFELARAYLQLGESASAMKFLGEYLSNEPRPEENRAMTMLAQVSFESEDWEKIIEIYESMANRRDLEGEVLFNLRLLGGQAYFRTEQYEKCLEPLRFVEKNTDDDRVKGLSQIMVTRALVELQEWEQLYAWVLRVSSTDRKYDISLNLTLMRAARSLYEGGEYLNALYLYRMVLPRETLIEHANQRLASLQNQTGKAKKSDQIQIENDIKGLQESITTLKDLPPYEQEITFRIGQIYSDLKRYWEGFVLFEKLYRDQPTSEIGEAAAMQSVMVLYAVHQSERADERVIKYVEENPDGQYARTMLALMARENLVQGNFSKVVEMRTYIDALKKPEDENDRRVEADLHYLLAFAYHQDGKPAKAVEQFSVVIDEYSELDQASSAIYYRGMSYMMQADYDEALTNFKQYQSEKSSGELYSDSLFREGVCLYGLERVPEAEATFSSFIEKYPSSPMVSEAYSMRGDIEASKEASADDPLTLDRAQRDYRKAIDFATTTDQASYAAFQAAKVYKLEYKWQEIVDLMNYYMGRWPDKADVAEAVYWKGQAQIELGQLKAETIPSYIDAIVRYGNDPQRTGVDKIIDSLIDIADKDLSPEEREGLSVKLQVKMTSAKADSAVLKLRLQVAQARLQGEDVAMALASELLDSIDDLSITTPGSLSLMCGVAVNTGNVEQMTRLSDYFIENFEGSDLLWHAYKARTLAYMSQKKYQEALSTIEQAQGRFGIEPFMGWAQLQKADALYQMGDYEQAENEYNMALNVPPWRGPIFAEAMFNMGKCRLAVSDYEGAHTFFQRTYLLFKAYDNGDWAAKGYLAAADCLNKLGRKAEAVQTLKAMLEDEYTKSNVLAEQVRELLRNYGG